MDFSCGNLLKAAQGEGENSRPHTKDQRYHRNDSEGGGSTNLTKDRATIHMRNLKASYESELKSQNSMLEMMAIVDDQVSTQAASIEAVTERLVAELKESNRLL